MERKAEQKSDEDYAKEKCQGKDMILKLSKRLFQFLRESVSWFRIGNK
jgi:hypothetical protein